MGMSGPLQAVICAGGFRPAAQEFAPGPHVADPLRSRTLERVKCRCVVESAHPGLALTHDILALEFALRGHVTYHVEKAAGGRAARVALRSADRTKAQVVLAVLLAKLQRGVFLRHR